MIYVGFVISVAEAQRLLCLNDTFAISYYDTAPIHKYLKAQSSKLVFRYIDKGACLFAIPATHLNEECERYSSIDQTIINILTAKKAFLEELKQLHVSIKTVNLTWIEKEEWLVENPEPYVISL